MGLLSAGAAHASGPNALADALDPQAIYGGTDVATCGWPTTVSMEGACSGTLVNPQVVIFAAHCGSNYNEVVLGESLNSPKRQLQVDFCKTYQGQQSGTDFAFCKLKEPVLDVPIVPILMGCETEILQPGQEVTIVGFGDADTGPYGVKREVVTTINEIQNNEAFIGGNGKDSCQGDSGGPVYVKLPDGSWRVFGITSYGGACGSGGYYSMMHLGMTWFEEQSGIDLTPCHNADGSWQPGFGCQGFPTDPGPGGGAWPEGCGGGPVNAMSATCGGPFDPTPDMTPPTVTVTQPLDGQELMGVDGVKVQVMIDAQDVGWGMKEVRLTIDGVEIDGGVDNFPPYEFPLTFPTGAYCIGAIAVDLADNMGTATPVCIGVNGPPPMPPEPETTGDESSSSGDLEGSTGDAEDTGTPPTTSAGATDDTGATGTPTTGVTSDSGNPTAGATGGEGEGEGGCGCRSGHDPKDSLLALAGLGLLGLARRRR
ncbi:MAG TPA: trypsin-like serine protease [Nannocystis sp.]